MAIKKTEIKLLEPAMATGFQSMDLMRTPPKDQKNAVSSRRKTYLGVCGSVFGVWRSLRAMRSK
jgi:hypothetical protein